MNNIVGQMKKKYGGEKISMEMGMSSSNLTCPTNSYSLCSCEKARPVVVRTSMTSANLGRRFYSYDILKVLFCHG